MKKTINISFFTVWATSVIYGMLVIPIDFLISVKSNSIGFMPAILLAFRSCGLIMLMVALFATIVFMLLRVLNRAKSDVLATSLQHAILIGCGAFVTLFFGLFDRLYNKYELLVWAGLIALMLTGLSYLLLRSGDRTQRLSAACPKASLIGTVVIVILFGISFLGTWTMIGAKDSSYGPGKSDSPNILLIVLDTVRADRLSLYGYHLKTTPFLEKMAEESSVFNNAIAPAPWTLPSHASLFTGLYPSQHNTHGEHFWLDDSFRTLAEMLYDDGYQTISFSNNDYVSSYHNLVQGFERSWLKGRWTDKVTMLQSFGSSVVSALNWFWERMQIHILAKIVENPVSMRDNPTAAVTNKAISRWLDQSRDESRPFFIFINYMDAHLPYNPNDETARLFLDEQELKASYSQRLRFPPIEHCIDLSKGGYTEADIRILSALYDACIRYLDGELEKLFKKLRDLGIYDETMIIITSDHGEYLGTRNRLTHGLGLHEEVLHVPLIARYPALFEAGTSYDTVVTHVDIYETILSFANIKERAKGMPDTQLLFDLKEDFRPNVFGEFRFPLHLLITASLRDDNSKWFVEQKTIRSQAHQLIWKSRGEPEFYNVIDDPSQVNDIYSRDNKEAEMMNQELLCWFESLHDMTPATPEVIGVSEKENLELIERLRGLGYVK